MAPKWTQRTISSKPDSEFPLPTPGSKRYILEHNYGCPFSCRAATARHLLGLDEEIPIFNFAPSKGLSFPNAKEGDRGFGEKSWVFDKDQESLLKYIDESKKTALDGSYRTAKLQYQKVSAAIAEKDPLFGVYSAREVYEQAKPEGAEEMTRYTVPILLDTQKKTVVSAESGDIVEMFWKEMKSLWSPEAKKWIEENNIDLFPEEGSELQKEMKNALDIFQNGIVFGLYGVGFAETQKQYEEALASMYTCMEKLETVLDTRRFVAGNKLTFADLSLAQALVRFDVAYFTAFRFNQKRVKDYKNIFAYMCDVVHLLKMHESSYEPFHIIGIYFGKRNRDENAKKEAGTEFVPVPSYDAEFTKAQLTQHGRDTRKY